MGGLALLPPPSDAHDPRDIFVQWKMASNGGLTTENFTTSIQGIGAVGISLRTCNKYMRFRMRCLESSCRQGRNQLIFSGGKNDCSMPMFLTTKHVFKNFGEANCPVASLYAGMLVGPYKRSVWVVPTKRRQLPYIDSSNFTRRGKSLLELT